MDRRSFLVAGGAAAVAAGTGAAYWRWREITPHVHAPARAADHLLRDAKTWPAPSGEIKTDVLILGSGIAGLTAAWKMAKEGRRDVLIVDGPEPYGQAAGASAGTLAYPTGARYLPLPAPELVHVRELLHDLHILLRNPTAERPYYDERCILHTPQERVLYEGSWQEGVLPSESVPEWERAEHARFFAMVEQWKQARGTDDKPAFALPVTHSSTNPRWLALDTITLAQWFTDNAYRSPTLRWYLDVACRDAYGTAIDEVSAWAGLHYFCRPTGKAENAEDDTWLTWPDGLQSIATGLERVAKPRRRAGIAVAVNEQRRGVEVLLAETDRGALHTTVVKAERVVCALPLFVAARIMPSLRQAGFHPESHMPAYASWLVTNFHMRRFPAELPAAPLSWDNVVYEGKGQGYVVSTHQDIRVTPPERTVFTAYLALADRSPQEARRWLDTAAPKELLALASADLRAAYGKQFDDCVERADLTLRAQAMPSPRPGFRSNPGLAVLRNADGPVLFAHGDLSGLSVFEEASWWGYQAALKLLR